MLNVPIFEIKDRKLILILEMVYNETKLSNIEGGTFLCILAWVFVFKLVFTCWYKIQHTLKVKIICFEV